MFGLLRTGKSRVSSRLQRRPIHQVNLKVEELEPRTLLSVTALLARPAVSPAAATGGPRYGFTPSQVRHAYGFDQLTFAGGAVRADGTGQTIAIVEAYHDPNIAADLHTFDQAFGLPDPPNFTQVNQNGTTQYPGTNGIWAMETAMDVEWAHAIAPGANILLVETNSENAGDLLAGVDFARSQPGVATVSMSWATGEFSGERADDVHFTTPGGHQGVTFVAAAGDYGAGAQWPAVSPNVVAVGATSLSLDANGNYTGETAWSSTSGGVSRYEATPTYQQSVNSGSGRSVADVSYDGNPATGFAVYDTFGGQVGWVQLAGTSASAPQWAALVAIADQGRALNGLASLDGARDTLPLLYAMPAADFHDVTTGSSAAVGYDPATGRGTPEANRVIQDLMASPAVATPAPPVSAATTISPSSVSPPAIDQADNGSMLTITSGQSTVLFAVSADHGLYEHTAQAGWFMIGAPGSVLSISAASESSGDASLFAIGADHALNRYTISRGWDSGPIGTPGTIYGVSAGTDSNGRADVFALGGDGALLEWRGSSGWISSVVAASGTVLTFSAVGNDQVVAVMADHSVFVFDAHGDQIRESDANFAGSVSAVSDANGRLVIYVATLNGGLYRHDDPQGWTALAAPGLVHSISAGTDANGHAVVLALTPTNALYVDDLAAGWQPVNGPLGVQSVSAGGNDHLAMVTQQHSIFAYDDQSGWVLLTGDGFAAS